jgi:CRISPR/Cas system-associated protein Csm6
MTIEIPPELEAQLREVARHQGTSPQELAIRVLAEKVTAEASALTQELQPRDEWERRLLSAAKPRGVVLPNDATSSDGIYPDDP